MRSVPPADLQLIVVTAAGKSAHPRLSLEGAAKHAPGPNIVKGSLRRPGRGGGRNCGRRGPGFGPARSGPQAGAVRASGRRVWLLPSGLVRRPEVWPPGAQVAEGAGEPRSRTAGKRPGNRL